MRLRNRYLRDCNVSDQGCSKTANCERFNAAFANGVTSWPRHLFTGRRRVDGRCPGIPSISAGPPAFFAHRRGHRPAPLRCAGQCPRRCAKEAGGPAEMDGIPGHRPSTRRRPVNKCLGHDVAPLANASLKRSQLVVLEHPWSLTLQSLK